MLFKNLVERICQHDVFGFVDFGVTCKNLLYGCYLWSPADLCRVLFQRRKQCGAGSVVGNNYLDLLLIVESIADIFLYRVDEMFHSFVAFEIRVRSASAIAVKASTITGVRRAKQVSWRPCISKSSTCIVLKLNVFCFFAMLGVGWK